MKNDLFLMVVIIVAILAIIFVASVIPVEASTYTVQQGDMSLWCIADDQGLNFWDLVLANTGLGLDPDLIHVGDVIQLP